MAYNKQDLAGSEYKWDNERQKESFNGEPTRRLFDKMNGHQVLFMINLVSETSKGVDCQKIEELISLHLPPEPKSEISVLNWLKEAAQFRAV